MDKEKLIKGLSTHEAQESAKEHGTNALSSKEHKSIWVMFKETFSDIWIKILCIALFIKIALAIVGVFIQSFGGENSAIEILSIAIAILLSTTFSAVSEYKNTSRSQALSEEYSKSYAKVIRNSEIVNILTSDIVMGDTILIQAGDKVPCDGLLFQGNIKVSQAALNGESRDEEKIACDNTDSALSTDYSDKHKLFMGSVVTSSQGYMVATVLGDESELGKINKSLSQENEGRKDTSSLKLEKVANSIGKLAVVSASISAILHVFLKLTGSDTVNSLSIAIICAEAIMLAASVIIMAVPEGLPMMSTLVQSMNSESLYKKHILVSHKSSFSDSAYINLLFSDKTGTITEGNLSLVEFIKGDGEIKSDINQKEFLDSIVLNNLAKLSGRKAIGSNNMDRALLNYAVSSGYKFENTSYDEIADVMEFDSEKKCAEIQMKNGVRYYKGATENILDSVSYYMDDNWQEVPFGADNKSKLSSAMQEQAKRTMKLLAVAKKYDGKVVLFAVLCLRDNVRADVKDTIDTLGESGIQVMMVTGDGEDTAVAIAKEAGIIKSDDDASLTHEELVGLSDDELIKIMPDLRVVSRAKPLDKKRLVNLSQKAGYVCGMTGDGVNDAPALKDADVGFAMGDGTAVAQEAGDVVILNNSLTSIKDCILNSRTMAKSIGKFLIFQLTVNLAALMINVLSPILGWLEPFSVVQILWVNLIMDSLAAIAFGSEPPLERYMKQKPAKRTDSILTGYIKLSILTSALFITAGCLCILENAFGIVDLLIKEGQDRELFSKSFMFSFFIYSIIFNSLNTRSEKYNLFEKLTKNKKFVVVMSFILIMQTVLLEFAGRIFSTTPLSAKALLTSLAMSVLIIPFDMLKKLIFHTLRK